MGSASPASTNETARGVGDEASLRWFEELSYGCLGTRNNKLEIEVASDGRVFSERRSVLGYADADTITIRSDVMNARPEVLSGILRHEMVHVIQKRLARYYTIAPILLVQHYEVEAEMVRLVADQDLVNFTLSPDPTKEIRYFEEDGHYYTTYLAAVLGGVPGPIASKIAFYSQLPDLIWELDAISVGIFLGMSGGEVRWSEAPIKYLRLLGDRKVPAFISATLPEYAMHLQKNRMPVVGGSQGRTPRVIRGRKSSSS